MLDPQRKSQLTTATLALLLIVMAVVAVQLIQTLRAHQRMQTDLAELNDIKYGMLNADAWIGQVSAIIEKKINEFQMTPENRKAIKKTLERTLDVLITEADRYLRKQKEGAPLKKRMKESVREKLMDIEQVKAGIPGYADQILDELSKPKARRELNAFLKDMLKDVSQSTFAELDTSLIDAIKEKYGCVARPSCQAAINKGLDENQMRAVQQTTFVLALTVLMFLIVALGQNRARLLLLTLCCSVLMAVGVLTPMIEVEARISSLSFVLLGEPVEFTDQVLYFQSKSVLDVVTVLTRTGKPDMFIVGILIMTFSVIFPLAKLAASSIYLYAPHLRRWPPVHFFALKSSKWSMADVFVVALFMAYIGFSGLISSQLSTFAVAAKADVEVLTTNGTSLQIGFFMFLAFCLASLLTSTLIDGAMSRESGTPDADPGYSPVSESLNGTSRPTSASSVISSRSVCSTKPAGMIRLPFLGLARTNRGAS